MSGATYEGFSGGRVPPKQVERHNRSFAVFALTAFLVGMATAILFFFNPSQHSFYPICYFHSITGLDCPGCGSLRAMHQLLHGHVAEAARLNALLLLCLPYLGWLTVRYFTARLRGQTAAFTVQPVWLWSFLCATVVFTVWRNSHAFSWFAP